MAAPFGKDRARRKLWAVALFAVIVAFVYTTMGMFTKKFDSYVPVTLLSDRSGLILETGAEVKLRGVPVGEVGAVTGDKNSVSLQLKLFPDQVAFLPANVQARIQANTIFGAKYVELLYPDGPSPNRLAPGAVLRSGNVSTEVNTVFENLVGVLDQIDPAKLNSIVSALAQGVRGRGERIGEATSGLNQVLLELNPRSETIRRDFRSLKGFADTYSAVAQDILSTLDAASSTSETVTKQAEQLDALLINLVGFAHSGVNLLAPNRDNIVRAINDLEPTTALLAKYNPVYTCLLVGAKTLLDSGYYGVAGGDNGKSLVVDAALLFGDDPYRYPDNLPIIGAKGGPDGKPGCGSLPDVAKNFPVRNLVTNTGWGTGIDNRPNPGIGRPFYNSFFPVTRGNPEPPALRGQDRGPAPGPIPYPDAPPYGAPMYAPDGTPLYPGVPPAPPPMSAREPGPTPPGTEPFVVPSPAEFQPNPPVTPPPVPAAPSP
ncbi:MULTISPECIES: MCE family protein [Mycolicibacterium]|uniref:MCE family protein n=1 Tax=Mycolicibacterium TaxID=1866885 RepID=UPI0007ED074F|nr:MCE family protein [Mycolicibacterium fortuitum]NOP99230.1 MCE family protein [Mycolicibacterium fortuitum]OBJ95177.1 MCE-family protein MCE3A [Mycolicibacterium fortuitum]